MSIQSGTSPGAIISAGETPPAGAVTSVFGRAGVVVAVAGDYGSDEITNESGVVGVTVSDALDTLAADAFVPGDSLFNVVVTAVPYQALVGDFVLSTDSSVTTPVAPADGEYFAVKNMGVLPVSIIGTVDGSVAYAIEPSTVAANLPSTWFVWSAANASWEIVAAYNPATAYRWIWANATARLAQVTSVNEVGFVGYQTDMAREYKLLAISGGAPNRWGQMADTSQVVIRRVLAAPGTALSTPGTNAGLTVGTAIAIAPNGATNSTRLLRYGIQTDAVAGSVASIVSIGVLPLTSSGYRFLQQFTIETVSANQWMFFGMSTTFPNVNIDPGLLVDAIGVGRSAGEANLQIIHSDAVAGVPTIDLGADFPANLAAQGYELELYSYDGTSISYQVRNLDSQAEISGTLTTDLPRTSIAPLYSWYTSNNIDASVVMVGIGSLQITQRSR